MTPVPMTTERLRIRALNEGDLAAVFAIVGDHTVANGATWLQPDLESCRGYLARRIAEEAQFGYSIWGIERLDERDLIGLAGYAPHGDEIELAYSIRADQWGRGLPRRRGDDARSGTPPPRPAAEQIADSVAPLSSKDPPPQTRRTRRSWAGQRLSPR